MILKQRIWYSIITLFILLVIHVQNGTPQNLQKRQVIVNSTPPGATIYFEGENSFVGVSPFKLRSNIQGIYNIRAFKSGYEKKSMQYFFKGSENGILRITLNPKTRLKAGMRSFVFPGWGQYYSERKKYGLFTSVLQLSAGVATIISHSNYQKAVNEYDDALSDYEKYKTNYELENKYWNIAATKYDKANKAYDKRTMWLAITGGLWIYNMLDAIFFFPSFEQDLFNRSVPVISTNFQQGGARLNISMSF